MNSSYGKTALKNSDSSIKIMFNHEVDKYVVNHANNVIKSVPFGQQSFIYKINNKLTHFNRVHIGSIILSMSKRIMNEVMCLAE